MPSFTVHYAASANSPPIGDAMTIEATDPEVAFEVARNHYTPKSHQPSAGDVRGFWVCDQDKQVVASWWEGQP